MKCPKFLFAIIAATVIGCGPGETAVKVTPTATGPSAKQLLEDVANSGELGSGAEGIRTALEALKATDGAKADALLKELDDLQKAGDPEQVKAKAKAMADKL